MSLHSSLKVKNKHVRKRNVLRREERVRKLEQDERWTDGNSVYGLPKVRVEVRAPRKHAKEAAAEPEEGEGAPAPGQENGQ